MSKVWICRVVDGKILFSPFQNADFKEWSKSHSGTQVRIEPVKRPVSRDLRGYYYAAVLPLVRSTCDSWKDLSSTEMHEVIKKLFFYFEAENPLTKRTERFGRSVMSDSEWNNTSKAGEFLMILGDYLANCGLELPDSKEYIALRDGLKDTIKPMVYPKNDLHPTL